MIWLAIFIVIIAAGVVYQKAGTFRDRRRYPPPGTLIDAEGTLLHAHSSGEGPLPVILEAGIAASSVSWSIVQPRLAKFTRAISYDRAGFAWSGMCKTRRTPEQIVSELDAVVRFAGGRCVLVGHSFGALIARLYAVRNRERVAGLVLVDSALLHEWADPTPQRLQMLGRGIRLSRRGALLCRAGIVRLALSALTSGARWLPKAVNRASSGRGAQVTERLVGEVRKLPPELWPAIQSHWSRPECFESMAAHLESLPAVAKEVARSGDLGDLPLIVISGAHLSPEALEEHRSVARLSSRGKHVIAERGGHWVHLDQPEVVVDAVRDAMTSV